MHKMVGRVDPRWEACIHYCDHCGDEITLELRCVPKPAVCSHCFNNPTSQMRLDI